MGRTERLFQLANLLRDPIRLRFDELMERLSVSPATLKRDLKYLRERLGTPVAYDSFDRSYHIADTAKRTRSELPGLWFGPSELFVLMLAHRFISEIDPQGLLAPSLRMAVERIEQMLTRTTPQHELLNRVKLLIPGKRAVDASCFAIVSEALARRQRLRLNYFTRSRGATGERDVSPQRLVFHRTWYLDAWCHRSEALRRFSLDAVNSAQPLEQAAREVALDVLEQRLDGAYGAFAGEALHWAVLEFKPQVAPWVAREVWHPMQRMRQLASGGLELMLPYQDPTELVMDILRYGDDVEVVASPALRATVATKAAAIARLYAAP